MSFSQYQKYVIKNIDKNMYKLKYISVSFNKPIVFFKLKCYTLMVFHEMIWI
jgi:hypothetical protein